MGAYGSMSLRMLSARLPSARKSNLSPERFCDAKSSAYNGGPCSISPRRSEKLIRRFSEHSPFPVFSATDTAFSTIGRAASIGAS